MFRQDQAFESRDVVHLTGVTERELRHWADRGIVVPAFADAVGRPGIRRKYSFDNLVEAKIMKQLVLQGLSVTDARRALQAYQQSLDQHFPGPLFLVVRNGQPSILGDARGSSRIRAHLAKLMSQTSDAVLVVPVTRIREELIEAVRTHASP